MSKTPRKPSRKGARRASSGRADHSIRALLIKTADRCDDDHFEISINETLSSEIGSIKIGQLPQACMHVEGERVSHEGVYCPYCGKANVRDASYCNKCGKTLPRTK